MSLKVKCDNTANGCQWIGELRSIEEHLTNCDFALLPCPNQCLIGRSRKVRKIMRKDIENHMKEVCPRRQYECPHCKESGEYRERTNKHCRECPKVRIPCPNDGCDEQMPRCEMSNHSQECLFESVPCKFRKIGCNEMIPRRNLEKHQNDYLQQHLQLAIDTVDQQQKTIKQVEERIVQLRSTPMSFRMTNFDQFNTSKTQFFSPGFYTSPSGYKMQVCVKARGSVIIMDTHVSVFAFLMRGENDNDLPWPFTGTVTIELLNQLEDDNHHLVEVNFPPLNFASKRVVFAERSPCGYGKPYFISHSNLGYVADKHCQYLKDDCLYFRVNVAKITSKPWLIL